ncbi:hypothetical protein PG997_012075 [Apiospora hydei]|uniref:Uncharacterized protein n=1 Tax=Apiospora hydei TaxID=1337664 RepID=A0ABR1V5Q8_9PEZI
MTESVSGSSLLQARGDTHSISHDHSHNHHIRSHHKRLHHQHQHQHLEKKDEEEKAEDSSVVHIVQTVDVIAVIDGSGATISLHTAAAPRPPTNSALAPPNGLAPALPDQKVAVASPTDDAADDTSPTIIPTPTPSLEPDSSASLSMSPSFPTVESYAKITSTPLPSGSGSASGSFPSFSGVTKNTTSTTNTPTSQPIISPTPSPSPSPSPSPLLSSSPTSLLSNGTVTLKPFLETNLTTSTLPNSSGTVLFNASFTTTLQSSDYVTASIAPSTTAASSSPHATPASSDDGGSVGVFDGAGGGDSTAESGPSPSATLISSGGAGSGSSADGSPDGSPDGSSDGSSGSGSKPTPPGTVAGSVIGSVAGVAFLLVLALMLLRWKKRQNALKLRDSNKSPGGLITGAGVAAGKDNPFDDPHPPATANSSAMSQRRSAPFAIPAALANLTGSQKRYSDRTDAASVEGGEKGFQKVSGRKLPSVLHYGGDGYSEPSNRDTVMSDQSSMSYYRDSQGFFSGPGMPRLALGSPMRPESGVPVFHEGPARKAQTETGHFSPTNLEPPARDPLGRSHPSQDGSNRTHGSASRFTEEI